MNIDEITQADSRRIIDIYFRSSFTSDNELIDESKHIYKANPHYKTNEFKDTHKYALFKILTEYHKIYYHLSYNSYNFTFQYLLQFINIEIYINIIFCFTTSYFT